MSRAAQSTRAAAVGALFGPPAVTALLLALDYRLLPLGGLRSATPAILYVVALGALGATVAAAYRLGLHATVVLAVAATVAAAAQGLFAGGDVLSFLAASMLLAAGTAVVAVAEFTGRRPDAASRMVPPETARQVAAVGVAHFAAWLALRSVAVGGPTWRLSAFTAGLWVWVAVGTVALGAVPVVLWRERGLVAPGAVVAAGLAWVAWVTLAGRTVGAGGSLTSLATVYGVGWFLPLAVALAAGTVEYAIRARLG